MRIVLEEAVGETRAAVINGDRAVELHLERWSERGARVQRGEVFRARVRTVDAALNGAFCDLGRGPEGFLPFPKSGRPETVVEGAGLKVAINREAFGEKGPTLTLIAADPGPAPACLEPAAPLAERLAARFDAPIVSARKAELDLGGLFEAALDRIAPLPGGGRLIIEPTAALVAIDVDAAGRKAQGGPAKLALEVNKAAAKEAARQIRLRGLGGVAAIDFLPLVKKADRAALEQTLRAAFKGDPAKIDIAPLSRFSIVELARQRLGRALHEVVGADRVESAALAALRALEREGRANTGARLALACGAAIYGWLKADAIAWRAAMTDRLGPRFDVVLETDRPATAFEVKPQ